MSVAIRFIILLILIIFLCNIDYDALKRRLRQQQQKKQTVYQQQKEANLYTVEIELMLNEKGKEPDYFVIRLEDENDKVYDDVEYSQEDMEISIPLEKGYYAMRIYGFCQKGERPNHYEDDLVMKGSEQLDIPEQTRYKIYPVSYDPIPCKAVLRDHQDDSDEYALNDYLLRMKGIQEKNPNSTTQTDDGAPDEPFEKEYEAEVDFSKLDSNDPVYPDMNDDFVDDGCYTADDDTDIDDAGEIR